MHPRMTHVPPTPPNSSEETVEYGSSQTAVWGYHTEMGKRGVGSVEGGDRTRWRWRWPPGQGVWSGLVSWGDDHEGHGNENGEETGQGGREVGGTLAPNEAAMREPRTPPEPAPITKRSYINSLAMVDRNRCGEWNSETEKRGEEKGDGRGGAGNSLSVTNEYVYGRFSQQYNNCEWSKIRTI